MNIQYLRERLSDIFEINFKEREELGASVSVWVQGEEVVSFARGYCDKEQSCSWDENTLIPVWSATKGLAVACVLKLLDTHNILIRSKVTDLWPEFGQSDKEKITFKQLLSHQAAIPAIDEVASIFDYDDVIKSIEKQNPLWEVGTGHGYHPRIFGFLLDEIVRRLEGMSLGEYFHQTFAVPMSLNFWIGLPEELHSRVATLYPGKMSDPDGEREFYRSFADPNSLTRKAFGSPKGLAAVSGMNLSNALSAGWPALGGVGTASSLAKFYAMLSNKGKWKDKEFISDLVLAQMSESVIKGKDQVLCLNNSFSNGFMLEHFDANRRPLYGGSMTAFGHPGAGGSHAFADPEYGIAFAYTMNQMNYGVLPGPKSLDMVDAIYES